MSDYQRGLLRAAEIVQAWPLPHAPKNLLASDIAAAIRAEAEKALECKTDPRAPHGFLRNESHSTGRYVCECEFWEPPPDEALIEEAAMVVAGPPESNFHEYGIAVGAIREYLKWREGK